jgi:hypothetical protein
MPERKSKELYVCLTPYHTILALAIALQRREVAESRLILAGATFNTTAFCASLQEWNGSPFSGICTLGGLPRWIRNILGLICSPGRVETIREVANAGRNARTIARFTRRFAADTVYVCNDWSDLTQCALHVAKLVNPHAVGVYVEDGLDAYVPGCLCGPPTRKRRMLRSLFARTPWYEHVSIMGTSRWIDRCMLLYPALLRSELKHLPCSSISADSLKTPESAKWVEDYLLRCGGDPARIAATACILAPALSSVVPDPSCWKEFVAIAVDEMRKHSLPIAVKYHPREWEVDYLGVAACPDVLVLPREISMECVFLQSRKNLRYVLGDTSTAMMTAGWLANPTAVIGCSAVQDREEAETSLDALARVGVMVVRNVDELRDVLRSCPKY